MIRYTRAALAIITCVTFGVTLPAQLQPGAANGTSGPSIAEELQVKGLKRLSQVDEVWIDEKGRAVVLGGQVCLDEGPLEMFACPRGTKEYESVVAVNAKAFVVHTALLAIGMKTGHPVRFQPEYTPASGSRIKIDVHWKEQNGNWRSANARDWIQDASTKLPLREDWVFAGSGFWKDPDTKEEFYYAEGGELICVSNFSTAMMDLPIESSQRDTQRLYQAFTENIPPLGTRVKLVLTPSAERKQVEQLQPDAELETEKLDQEVNFQPGKQTANVFVAQRDGSSVDVPYLLFTPKHFATSGEAMPFILFLHGFGECGNGGEDLKRVMSHGPPRLAQRDENFPFIVLSPQCPQPVGAMDEIVAAWQEDQVIQVMDHVMSKLPVDRKRVYVTGLSMGGFGTWRIAARYPDRFAAAVPICGGGRDEYAASLKDMPIWCFHGAQDPVVELKHSQAMIQAIQAAGGTPKFTVYRNVQHDSWVPAYNDPALFKWLLSHSLETRDHD